MSEFLKDLLLLLTFQIWGYINYYAVWPTIYFNAYVRRGSQPISLEKYHWQWTFYLYYTCESRYQRYVLIYCYLLL